MQYKLKMHDIEYITKGKTKIFCIYSYIFWNCQFRHQNRINFAIYHIL